MFLRVSRQVVVRSIMLNLSSRSLSTLADSRHPTKLRVDFYYDYSPTDPDKLVDRLIFPTKRGLRSILPGHENHYAGLATGVLSLVSGNETTKYFVSSGHLFIHLGYIVNICTASAIPLDHIDADTVKKALAKYRQKLSSTSTDLEKATKVERSLEEFTQKLSTVLTKLGKVEALSMLHSQAS